MYGCVAVPLCSNCLRFPITSFGLIPFRFIASLIIKRPSVDIYIYIYIVVIDSINRRYFADTRKITLLRIPVMIRIFYNVKVKKEEEKNDALQYVTKQLI